MNKILEKQSQLSSELAKLLSTSLVTCNSSDKYYVKIETSDLENSQKIHNLIIEIVILNKVLKELGLAEAKQINEGVFEENEAKIIVFFEDWIKNFPERGVHSLELAPLMLNAFGVRPQTPHKAGVILRSVARDVPIGWKLSKRMDKKGKKLWILKKIGV